MSEGNLFEQQARNKRRSTWLTVGFVLFTAWIGFGGDLGFYLLTRDAPADAYHHVIPFIGIVAGTIAGSIACDRAADVVDPVGSRDGGRKQ